MKYQKPRPHPKKKLPEPARLFRQPAPDFYRLPDFEIRGGYILTDGCRRVLDFDPQKLCLDMGRFVITFYGSGLGIESLAGKRLVVAGRVERIDFKQKWGQADETL